MRRGAAQQKRGAFIRAGKEGWRGGTEEQTGLCSLCTHDYCMRKSKVSTCSSGMKWVMANLVAFTQLHLIFKQNINVWENTAVTVNGTDHHSH